MMRTALAFIAPVLAVSPVVVPLIAQQQPAAEAAAETAKAAPPAEKPAEGKASTAEEEAELVAERRKRAMINDVMRCPKRPTEEQFRFYNLLSDQSIKLKQRQARHKAAERRLADMQRQILAQREELLKLQRLLDEKLTEKELEEAAARTERIRKLVKIFEKMRPDASASAATGITMDLLVELLLRMKPKSAASVMNLVPPPLASRTFEEVSNRRKGLIEALLERVEANDAN